MLLSMSPMVEAIDFNSEVAPLLVRRCVECHKDVDSAGGLNLTKSSGLRAGGESGAAVDADRPGDSLLLQRVVDGEMPPAKRGESQKLPPEEIAILQKWIQTGAEWPKDRKLDLYESTSSVRGGRDWWSLQPVVRPQVPQVQHAQRVSNPVDAFVLARLEAQQMEPAPLAPPGIRIRRLYQVLLGLPPTKKQIDAFQGDASQEAWSKQVQTLLDSPHYGERWDRHWLDVVRFAETSGYERDQEKPFAWKYRDWVVAALNADKPYDRFVLEQLAGDELGDRSKETVVATGLLRLGTWNDEPNQDADYQYERLEDLVHATTSAFLGLTVKCARCHDHKFDPIPQVDYYRIAAAFWAGPIASRDRKLLGGPTVDELGYDDVLGWTDVGREARPLHVLKNGERHAPLGVAAPGSLSAIPASFRLFDAAPAEAKTTQRRRQLAEWIASRENPLTARVVVNRLWQHHFGQGLVRSPNNFGFRGDLPTHPKLLDWLAAELMDHDWSLKHIHRLILTSTTWQQASSHPQFDLYRERDFANQSWWHAPRRRIDAEALRDRLLFVSGELDLRAGGPSFRPTIAPEALEGLSRRAAAWVASPPKEQLRRSLYMYSKRHLISPWMTTFDFCDTTLPCAQREVTTVAPQALALLNHAFVHQRSQALAQRVAEIAGADERLQVETAWELALGRSPTAQEIRLGVEHLRAQRTRFENPEPAAPAAGQADAAGMQAALNKALVLHVRADSERELDEAGRLISLVDRSGKRHHVSQSVAAQRPLWVERGIHDRPVIRFDGEARWLQVYGKLLDDANCTVIAVGSDQSQHGKHRSIVSNWNRTNSTTSLFLGLTGDYTVRLSDQYSNAGRVAAAKQPFLLTAVSNAEGARTYQSTSLISKRTQPLMARNLETPWVIGQQGNIDGEYWNGDIAEVRIYSRALTPQELSSVWQQLIERYEIAQVDGAPSGEFEVGSPAELALASLCQVLFNSNEFVYVD